MAVGPILAQTLNRYGLSSLTQWASEALVKGWSEDQIVLELWERPEFKTRFKGMFLYESNGHGAMSPDEWLSYERTVKSTAATWGMDLTQDEIDNLGGNNVSPAEFSTRAEMWATAVYDTDAETRQSLQDLFGFTTGQLMRYYMDPKAELPKLQQQFRMSEIAGSALRSNYGKLTADQAKRLADSGLTREQAATSFGQFAAAAQLFSPLDFGEGLIDQDTQVEALAGDAGAQQQIDQRAQRRKAEFEGGGGFAASQTGFATGTAK